MTVGICGLGLIGGSMAKAYHGAGHTVLGYDRDEASLGYALLSGMIDGRLDERTVAECELLLIALYPQAAIEYLVRIAPSVSGKTVVMDLCGTKKQICEVGFRLALEYGFTFVGGHPMAGTQFSGFANSRKTMFTGAPMVLVFPEGADAALCARCKALLAPVGFGSFAVSDAETHDRVIAFTSQLAHVVSNAYVKSPQAQRHHGFSAGSYRDLTRVAWLNEKMWCELFLENRDFLAEEIDNIINALTAYREALDSADAPRLTALLREGRIAKENADKDTE